MTRYLLDTNLLNEVVRPAPSDTLVAWLAEQRDADLFIATFSLAEMRRGLLQLPAGRRRADLKAWFLGPEGPPSLFKGRILGFDELAAEVWAELMAEGQIAGRPRSALDMIIAAVAKANGCVLASANERHFAGVVDFLNPTRSI